MVILIRERGRTCQYSLRTGWQHLLSHILDYFLTLPSKWSNFFVESHSQIGTFKKRAKSKFSSLFFFGCFNASFSEWEYSQYDICVFINFKLSTRAFARCKNTNLLLFFNIYFIKLCNALHKYWHKPVALTVQL